MWPFSKKPNQEVVEIKVDDGRGGKVWKRVDKAEFDALLQPALTAGAAKIFDVCKAKIIDPMMDGIYETDWLIGSDIPQDLFDKFASDGVVYVLRFYEDGKPVTNLMQKHLWEAARQQLGV